MLELLIRAVAVPLPWSCCGDVALSPADEKCRSWPYLEVHSPVRKIISVGLFVFLSGIVSLNPAWAVEGICKPGIVQRDGRFVMASMKGAWERVRQAHEVRLKFLGHSSFLITAPGGARAVMDPYVIPILDPPPDAVTVSNLHETHSMTAPYAGKSEIFFGVTPEGKPNAIDEKFGNLRIASFPQMDGDENHPFVRNTIHVFQAGGLCVAHFGNAHFGPSPGQIRALGKIHVLLLPIDGSFTVPHDVAAKIVKRIGPNIVIPMHYFGPELTGEFERALRAEGITRVIRPKEAELVLTRKRLPPPTAYVVLPDVNVP